MAQKNNAVIESERLAASEKSRGILRHERAQNILTELEKIQVEFDEWDLLSDEALLRMERKLEKISK